MKRGAKDSYLYEMMEGKQLKGLGECFSHVSSKNVDDYWKCVELMNEKLEWLNDMVCEHMSRKELYTLCDFGIVRCNPCRFTFAFVVRRCGVYTLYVCTDARREVLTMCGSYTRD